MEIYSLLLGLSLWATPLASEAHIVDNALIAPKAPIQVSAPIEAELAPQRRLGGNNVSKNWLLELENYPELKKLADCESEFDEKAINPKDTDGHPKYGLFQYHIPTWLWFQELMGVSGLDIMSGDDQLKVTLWAINNGYAHHWGICL